MRESFRAYQNYVNQNGLEPKLPGLQEYTAEQMFFYLYLCPKYKYEWILLLLNLLENTSLDIILQTLNRIMVTGKLKNDKILEDIAKKLFIGVGEKNPLHFQKFDRLTKINSEIIHGINNHNKTVDFGIK